MAVFSARQSLMALAWLFPVLVMLAAYGAIAIHTGNWWPWLEIVHESGERSLLDTVLFYQHAARELPLDMVLGVAIGSSALSVLPEAVSVGHRRQLWLFAGLLLVLLVILAGTLKAGGTIVLRDNLLQMYTRPGEPLLFGSHWRYHFLSRLMLILGSMGLAGLINSVLRAKDVTGLRLGNELFLASLLFFFLLSLVFVPGIEPFTQPVYLGHQVREVLTHSLVTIPLGWWVCMALSKNDRERAGNEAAFGFLPVMAGSFSVSIGLYLLIGALITSAATRGQTDSLALLIFPHFFEHAFSYFIVALTAGFIFESRSVICHVYSQIPEKS